MFDKERIFDLRLGCTVQDGAGVWIKLDLSTLTDLVNNPHKYSPIPLSVDLLIMLRFKQGKVNDHCEDFTFNSLKEDSFRVFRDFEDNNFRVESVKKIKYFHEIENFYHLHNKVAMPYVYFEEAKLISDEASK